MARTRLSFSEPLLKRYIRQDAAGSDDADPCDERGRRGAGSAQHEQDRLHREDIRVRIK